MQGNALQDRHALVTGGGRGIGRAIAVMLAAEGCRVTITGRDAGRLAATLPNLTGTGHGIAASDVADRDGFQAALTAAMAERGPITILVNNAGIAPSAPALKQSLDGFQEVLAVDLLAPFQAIQTVVPGMMSQGFGRIINVASTAGLVGYRYVAAYVAAKHGLIGLTRALALEFARTGITVNAVCPGFTDTDLVAGAVQTIIAKTGRDATAAREELARGNPMGRLIAPEEVADAVRWLIQPAAQSVTGQAIVVAGGEVMP
ncbi:MAG: SDR family NAD(P)-dependent oxidoreductase [Alphaproteobacteria bacterium]|nr:SDR family NAD(P)-dependent oxidoreductase [Alphaproteobacteria bacterium]